MVRENVIRDAASVAAWHLRRAEIVAQPTITSPRSRQAAWPGAAPSARLAQLELERAVRRAPAVDAAGHGARAVAQLDARRPRRPGGAGGRRGRARAASRAASRGPTTTRFARASVRSTYSGSAAATPRPLRWPTVKWCAPPWRPSDAPPQVDDLARRVLAGPPWRARNARLAGAGQEAEVLGLGACAATGSPASAASARTSGLVSSAEREAHARERRRRERGEHVGLVLGRVGGGAQQPVLA